MSEAEAVEIISLGGCGGFGMNATLFRAAGHAILVDFGIGFPHEGLPGVERLIPDPRPLLKDVPRLDGILVTHAHDDHVGGLAHLPREWRSAPVWGTALTMAAARDRLADGPGIDLDLHRVDAGARLRLGPFDVEFVHVAHSTPQSTALAIDTPAGLVFHTGDIKLDPAPIVGPPTDLGAFARCRERGVRLLLLDSTGALRDGRSGSESRVADGLLREVERAERQVFCTLFSSHVDRVQSLLDAARATGRRVSLLGRRLRTMYRHGVDLGLIDVADGIVLPPEELGGLPPDGRLWLAGGCQGELGSTLSRISYEDDSRARIEPADTLIFSSSTIPGNEPLVLNLIDRMLRLGAEVLHADERDDLHVSGHGSRDELSEIIAALAPASVVPIHGNRRHLEHAARLARREGVDDVKIVERGEPLRLTRSGASTEPRADLPPLHVDAAGRIDDPEQIAARRRAARGGVVFVTIEAAGRAREIDVVVAGIAEPRHARRRAAAQIDRAIDAASRGGRRRLTRDEIVDVAERAAARAVARSSRNRPLVVVRAGGEGDFS